MIRNRKDKIFYYACPNKDSLYVNRWTPEIRGKRGLVVSE